MNLTTNGFQAGAELIAADLGWIPFETQVEKELHRFVEQVNYPCVAAKIAMKRKEYQIKIYPQMGGGKHSLQLGHDLIAFKNEQKRTGSKYLSFVAVFQDSEFDNEDDFEKALWAQLSAVSSEPSLDAPWDPNFSSDPNDTNFCFSLDGSAFFVVGVHPASSRKGRQFFKPALIFNLYEQFEALDEETEFYPMVHTNRKRDLAFQGSVNPMVEKYAEKWEAIQFSGKENPPEWKCPFHRLMNTLGLM